MTVYLGDEGAVQIVRKGGAPINGSLMCGDVSVDRKRFSLSDHDIHGELISGDQVDIRRTDGGNLKLVRGHNFPDWRGFVFVDQLGGIRLYRNFSDALVGLEGQAYDLVSSSETQQLEIQTRASSFNYLAKIRGYELTTSRETVNVTQLGDQFQQQYEAGLISGQGQLNCYFEFKRSVCNPTDCPPGTEFCMYLAQLCIRLTQGADFQGRFFVYHPCGSNPEQNRQAVWYDAECIVTNCIVNITATQAIEATINFVTTGAIRLMTGVPPVFIALEAAGGGGRSIGLLLQEQDDGRINAGIDEENVELE